MQTLLPIRSALISVFSKEGLAPLIQILHQNQVTLYSTGGTENFIKQLEIPVTSIEDITAYPSILGGRVKTLHPKVFGGILNRQHVQADQDELASFNIPQIDLVVVDLYPFEQTVASGASEEEIIEKIDIGGISLIRAAAKNFTDTTIISSVNQYVNFIALLENQQCGTTLADRRALATEAFHISSHYDTAIFNFFNKTNSYLKISDSRAMTLRYGENPHQRGQFFGDFDAIFEKLHGKELSYNNLLDVDAAVNLISEFRDNKPTFAILKHNNACGLSTRESMKLAYLSALSADPTSAFGGVLIANKLLDEETAAEINQLFCEVIIAPNFTAKALEILQEKKNRIILRLKQYHLPNQLIRTCLNGILVQDRDYLTDHYSDLKTVTTQVPKDNEIEDLLFASKICKNTKSNTIVLAKNQQLIASGTGQTSRVDALKQAIEKAQSFGFDLQGAVMASDAFFPFPDCVEIASKAGITAVIQPGGSIKDDMSINYCNENKVAMVFTGIRHFKH